MTQRLKIESGYFLKSVLHVNCAGCWTLFNAVTGFFRGDGRPCFFGGVGANRG